MTEITPDPRKEGTAGKERCTLHRRRKGKKALGGLMSLWWDLGRSVGHRPNCFLGLSLNDRTIILQVILLDKTVSVG